MPEGQPPRDASETIRNPGPAKFIEQVEALEEIAGRPTDHTLDFPSSSSGRYEQRQVELCRRHGRNRLIRLRWRASRAAALRGDSRIHWRVRKPNFDAEGRT